MEKTARRYKAVALWLEILGFLFSLVMPIWAAASKVVILARDAPDNLFTRLGITLSGGVLILCIAVAVSWRFFGSVIKENVKGTRRTLLGFFGIGYIVLLAIKNMLDALEAIFLGGAVGALCAVILYTIADILRTKAEKIGGVR